MTIHLWGVCGESYGYYFIVCNICSDLRTVEIVIQVFYLYFKSQFLKIAELRGNAKKSSRYCNSYYFTVSQIFLENFPYRIKMPC
jgi:hypothetical protein